MFELDDDYLKLQQEARAIARAVRPYAAEADASSILDPRVRTALADSGLAGLIVPAEHGGRHPSVDPLAVCVVREAFMAESSHLDSLFALQGIGSFAINVLGTPQQQQAWLPRVAALDAIAALALTEPEAGSDLKGLRTTVTPQGDELVMDGEKSFISNAGAADFYTVLAREAAPDGTPETPSGTQGEFSLILVPADTPGVMVSPTSELIAPHVLGEVRFDGVRLPASARLGAPGAGFDAVLATLAVFRVSVAGAAVGLAQAAIDEAVAHCSRRRQFGRPLARLGPVAALLADSASEVEAARLLTYRAAARAGVDPASALPESSTAKLFATEAAGRVVDRCVQAMGRWGLIHDSKIERLYRQARPMRIYEGASEVLRLGIARDLTERAEQTEWTD